MNSRPLVEIFFNKMFLYHSTVLVYGDSEEYTARYYSNESR